MLAFLVKSSSPTLVPVEELREGSILAEDLRRDGALLLPACTRLTEGAAKRIREACTGMKSPCVRRCVCDGATPHGEADCDESASSC